MRKKLKRTMERHWNCIPWFVCGLSVLIKGDIGRFTYGLVWISLITLLWIYCPADRTSNLPKERNDE